MLPFGIREYRFLLFYPLVGEFLAAAGAEPALATEADFFLVRACGVAALEDSVAPHRQPATEHFDDVIHDGGADAVFVLLVKVPPCAAFLEECFESGWESNHSLPSDGPRP